MGINDLKYKDIKTPKDFNEKVLGLVWKEGDKKWPPDATSSNSGTLAHGQVFADDNVPLNISSMPKGTVVNDYHAYCKYAYVYLQWLATHVKQNDSRYQRYQTSMMRNFLSVARRLVDKLSTGDNKATLSTFIKKLDGLKMRIHIRRVPPHLRRNSRLSPLLKRNPRLALNSLAGLGR